MLRECSPPHHVSNVTCHMVELDGGGSVINGAYRSSFKTNGYCKVYSLENCV